MAGQTQVAQNCATSSRLLNDGLQRVQHVGYQGSLRRASHEGTDFYVGATWFAHACSGSYRNRHEYIRLCTSTPLLQALALLHDNAWAQWVTIWINYSWVIARVDCLRSWEKCSHAFIIVHCSFSIESFPDSIYLNGVIASAKHTVCKLHYCLACIQSWAHDCVLELEMNIHTGDECLSSTGQFAAVQHLYALVTNLKSAAFSRDLERLQVQHKINVQSALAPYLLVCDVQGHDT
jgi:hypothetical protein